MQSSGAFLLHFHPIHGMLEPEEKWKTGEGRVVLSRDSRKAA